VSRRRRLELDNWLQAEEEVASLAGARGVKGMSGNLWSVVLAAGAGRRLSGITRGMPKQFWRPADGPSLLDSTLDRLAPICPRERTIIVVGEEHREFVRRSPTYRKRGRILFQPHNRGTATGLLFGLVPVVAADPDGVVVVTPSDHGVRNPHMFRRGIIDSIAHAQHPGGVVLFGVEPNAARDDYGWISLSAASKTGGIGTVSSFVEKPDFDAATQLLASGAVWNTMVLVARARALINLCRSQRPLLTAVFEQASRLSRAARRSFLFEAYPAIEAVDLSRDVLAHARGLQAYQWPASMGWSDLGTPERLSRWVSSLSGTTRSGDATASRRRPADLQTNRSELVNREESRP
jgi:mannose-1-phosphate guanylyltransferase